MNRFSVVFRHPRLWIILLLGVTIAAPLLITALLYALALGVVSVGANAIPAFVFTGVFGLFTLCSLAFWQALCVQAVHVAHQKKFTLVKCFDGVRSLFWRSLGLIVLVSIWLALLSIPVLFTDSVAVEIILGVLILLTPFVFLRSAVLLREHSVFSALKKSASEVRSLQRIADWAWVKTLSLVVLVILFIGSGSLLVGLPVETIVRVVLSFVALAWMGVLSPVFSLGLVLGGNGFGHVALLFVSSLLLWFGYVVILSRSK